MQQAPWILWLLLSFSISWLNGQWLWKTQAWEIKAREDHLGKQAKPSHFRDSGINQVSRQIQYDKGRPSSLQRLCWSVYCFIGYQLGQPCQGSESGQTCGGLAISDHTSVSLGHATLTNNPQISEDTLQIHHELARILGRYWWGWEFCLSESLGDPG